MKAQGKYAEGSQTWAGVFDGVGSLLEEGGSRGQLQRELGPRWLARAWGLDLPSLWWGHARAMQSPQRSSREQPRSKLGPDPRALERARPPKKGHLLASGAESLG